MPNVPTQPETPTKSLPELLLDIAELAPRVVTHVRPVGPYDEVGNLNIPHPYNWVIHRYENGWNLGPRGRSIVQQALIDGCRERGWKVSIAHRLCIYTREDGEIADVRWNDGQLYTHDITSEDFVVYLALVFKRALEATKD